ncbi:MAG: transcriptional regulator [Anaerolineales bacterium]|nr:transcriptional regulator [Anaerolineales bacterium]
MLQPQLIQNFEQMAKFIFVPTNEDEYNQLVGLLDEITDIVRDNEEHPLANLMDVIGVLIETCENQHVPEPAGDPVAALKYFMEEHGLKQKDLPELGSQGIVSEILSRKRELNLRQIKALSERFKVPAAVFME